jgi:SAM-dependent methyltransferase
MTDQKKPDSSVSHYQPTMTQDYSRISDTARAVDTVMLPKIVAYIQSISPLISGMKSGQYFVIADYGAADGVNSSELFGKIIAQIHDINPLLKIKLVYIDIADRMYFDKFWKVSKLAKLEYVTAEYIKRSFYEPFPELAGQLNLGFSSTSLHWLNTETVDSNFFKHHDCIQANQLGDFEREKFVGKWRDDWRIFFGECSYQLVEGGALFLANLANLGGDRWPASPGYNNMRDICRELCVEGKITPSELKAIFVPDYFATPDEMKSLFDEDGIRTVYSLKSSDEMTVPCAYFSKVQDKMEDLQEIAQLSTTLAHVVRAWSESSIRVGLSPNHKNLVEEIYVRLRDRFYVNPGGLPYQYCLLEVVKK